MLAQRLLQTRLALCLILCCVTTTNINLTANATSTGKESAKRTPLSTRSGGSVLIRHLARCGGDAICIRLLTQYGGMFAADSALVSLPPAGGFRNEAEVQTFQRRAGIAIGIVEKTRIELQPAALQAFRSAVNEARQRGLMLTLRGSHPGRRSYATTLALWTNHVTAALDYWIGRGELTKFEAQELRALTLQKQVARILALEARQIYFGTGFKKSILYSVAVPGTSQHNAMLAVDIVQYTDPRIRLIMANHGWFQTVKNDAPHFTYLGVEESKLLGRGLKRETSGGITAWIPNLSKRRVESSERKVASDNRAMRMTMNVNVEITETLRAPLSKLGKEYYKETGDLLHITSGYRSPKAQATVMYQNLKTFGVTQVLDIYRRRAAAVEIVNAYLKNSGSSPKAIKAMTTVIERQVKRGIYVSHHLRGRAVDIRLTTARRPVLNRVVRGMGGRLAFEINHYHVEF